jgi:hypothetical protein
MLRSTSAVRDVGGMANEVSDELPILHPIIHNFQLEKLGGSIVGNLFTSIRLRKGDRDRGDRYSVIHLG